MITFKEYQLLIEGKVREDERTDWRVRDICYHSIAPHLGKNTSIRKPSDMWAVTREERKGITNNYVDNVNAPKAKKRRRALSQDFKALNINFA